jgi:hypothetical protein
MATNPPNLPGKEKDTGFVMYDWLKRMRQWAIDSYNLYVLKESPSPGQTLTGTFTFNADPSYGTTFNVNTPAYYWDTVRFSNGFLIYSPDLTSTQIGMYSDGFGYFSIYDDATPRNILGYDTNLRYLETSALRILGDFSNATVASRTSFQTSSANGATHTQAIPTGTSTTSSFRASGTSDIANANIGSFGVTTGTEVRIQSTVAGTVTTYIPIVVYNGGVEVFRFETDGRVSGTKLHNTGTVTGTTQQYIASGTYTPTATDITNSTAGTCEVAKWTRVGNVVSVSGRMALTPTAAATTTVWGLSLPIASNFAATSDLNGLVNTSDVASTTRAGFINADTTNDRANLTIRSSTNASENYYYMYQYEVL